MRKKLDPGRPILDSDLIGSCYYIRRNPPLESKTSVFLSGYGFYSDFCKSQNPQKLVLSSWGRFPFAFPRFKIQNFTFHIHMKILFRIFQDLKSKTILGLSWYRFILGFSRLKIQNCTWSIIIEIYFGFFNI